MSFSREVKAKGDCVLSSVVFFDDWGRCEGVLDAHHVIPKRRIKGLPKTMGFSPAFKREMVADARNGLPVCRKHHGMLSTRQKLIPAEVISDDVHEFAIEYRLEHLLERELTRRPSGSRPIVTTMPRNQGRASRQKGKRGELEVVNKFKECGFNAAARTQRGAAQHEGDISGVPDMVEVRRRETLSLPAWLAECRAKAKDTAWALIFRTSRTPWTVAIDLDHYLDLLKRANEKDTSD